MPDRLTPFTADEIFNTLCEPLLVIDQELRVVRCNEAYCNTFQVVESETIGNSVYQLGDGQWNVPAFTQWIESIPARSSDFKRFEVNHNFPGIGPKIMRLNARRMLRKEHQTELILLAIEDITAAEAAKKESAQNQERLRVTISSIGDAVITTDAIGQIQTMNIVAENLTGWNISDAIGKLLIDVLKIVNQDTRQIVANPLEKAIGEGAVVGLANHTILISKDGREFALDDSAAPIRDIDGSIIGGVIVFRDITERRKNEVERARLVSIVENSGEFIGATDLRGEPIYLNRAGRNMVGLDANEGLSKLIVQDLFSLNQQDTIDNHILPTLKSSGRWEGEFCLKHRRSSAAIPVYLELFRVADPHSGETINFATIARDITEQKRISNEIQQAAEFNRSLMDGSIDCIKILSTDGRLLHMNTPGLCAMEIDDFGPLCGREWASLWPSQLKQQIELSIKNANAGTSSAFTAFCPTAKGTPRWWEVTVSPVRTSTNGPVVRLLSVSRDITERRSIELEMARQASALAEEDARKSEFLAMLAHELRNPLAPIRSGLELMQMGNQDPSVLTEIKEIMSRQVTQIVRLVDDLMDVSRISQGKLELRKEVIDLSDVLKNATDAVKPLLLDKQHTFHFDSPANAVRVEADSARLTQVFSNLLNNAAKYSNPNSDIWLSVRTEGSNAIVCVKDAGIGIDPAQLPLIFELFTQVENSLDKAQGGLGIGLTLVKRIIEMHSGTVTAKSEGVGRGSEFAISLPLTKDSVISNTEHSIEPTGKRNALRVLIVDDNLDGAKTLSMMLKMFGNEVLVAFNGESALEIAASSELDVVLLDIGLPGISGHQVCRELRKMPGGQEIVLIAQTGWGQESDRLLTSEAGFDYHLTKPLDPKELSKLLTEVQINKRI